MKTGGTGKSGINTKKQSEAVNEMLIRTSSPYAPWIVVEGNCKYYARIKVLETVVEAVEKKVEEKKQEKKRQEEKKGRK